MKKNSFFFLDIIVFVLIVFNVITSKFSNEIDCLIRYSATFLACFFAIISSGNKKDNLILASSTIFAFVADYFLLFDEEYSSIGIILFIMVQILYQFYINSNKKENMISIGASIGFGIIASVVIKIIGGFDVLESSLALSYIILSIINFVFSVIRLNKKENTNKYIFISCSILLLLLCDLCIGLDNITDISIFNSLEWIFYVPSQMLLFYQIYKNQLLDIVEEKLCK